MRDGDRFLQELEDKAYDRDKKLRHAMFLIRAGKIGGELCPWCGADIELFREQMHDYCCSYQRRLDEGN